MPRRVSLALLAGVLLLLLSCEDRATRTTPGTPAGPTSPPMAVTEEDGSPRFDVCSELIFPSGTLSGTGSTCQVTVAGGAGGGDNITIGGTAVDTTANFVSTGDITFTWTDGPAGGPDAISGTINTAAVSAAELDEAGVEAGLEAVLDLQDLQGAVTDAQVPDTITLTNITQITTRAVTSLTSTCTDVQVLGGTAAGTGVECQPDDDVPDSGDFGNAAGLNADGSLKTDAVGTDALNATAVEAELEAVLDLQELQGAVTDAQVPDTITASNYLPLTGGTLTGQLGVDNLGLELEESDTNPACAAGNYTIYADLSETKLKQCVNGVIADLGGAAAGGGDLTGVGNCTTGNCGIEGGNDLFPLLYEGTANTSETTLTVTDPTADRTITFPDASGEVSLLGQSITDAEVDDTITLVNITQITNRAITSLTAACTDAQVVGGNAAGTGVECQTDDDVPELGDFDAAQALEADGSLSANAVGALALDEAAVEAGLEAVLDLQDLQGAVTDAQVPDTITLTNLTQISTRPFTSLTATCTDAQVVGGNAGATALECQADDDTPDSGDFGNAAALNADGSLKTDAVGTDALNATAVESELEAVLDLQDLQGAVTDAQVANNITLDNLTQVTTRPFTALSASCTDAQVVGGNAGATALECQVDDDTPESGDFAAAVALEADGSLSTNTVAAAQMADGDHGGIAYTSNVVTVESVQSGTAFPGSPAAGDVFVILDDTVSGLCTSGGGTAISVCRYDGADWVNAAADAFVRNQKADCSGDITAGLLCYDTDTGTLYLGNGSDAAEIGTGGGGAGSPPGSDTQVIFNDAGAFGADSGMTYNKTTDTLTVGGVSIACNTATQECVSTVPNETANVSAAADPNTCQWGIVNDEQQWFCNGSARKIVTTNGDTQTLTNKTLTSPTINTATLTSPTISTPTVNGGSFVRQKVTVNTNPYTMLSTDCGKTLFIETGAGEIDLIADPTVGVTNGACMVCFYQKNAVTLLLDPNSTDIISGTDSSGTALTLAAGDRLQLSAVVGANVCLQGYSASEWVVWPSGVGTLSDAN